jgi:hypothetical protein
MGKGIALLFHDLGTRRGWVVSSTPQPLFTLEKDPVPIVYRRLGGPQSRSGQAWKISPSAEFDPRTLQPVGQAIECYWKQYFKRQTRKFCHKRKSLKRLRIQCPVLDISDVETLRNSELLAKCNCLYEGEHHLNRANLIVRTWHNTSL